MNTEIKNAITAADAKIQYDTYAKRLLAQKSILANILVKTVAEFKDMKPSEVAREAARKRIDEKADAMNIEVKVPNYNLYDTHNIQEELAKNINDIFSDEESFKPPFERKTGMSEVLNESPAKTSESRTDGTADSNAGNANTVYVDDEAENIEDHMKLSIRTVYNAKSRAVGMLKKFFSLGNR